jgi:hypothetical protein
MENDAVSQLAFKIEERYGTLIYWRATRLKWEKLLSMITGFTYES